jgi:hypothetical protein
MIKGKYLPMESKAEPNIRPGQLALNRLQYEKFLDLYSGSCQTDTSAMVEKKPGFLPESRSHPNCSA